MTPAADARWWRRVETVAPRRLRLVLWSVIAVPFVLAALRLLGRHYHPVLDQAMTEFRVRDVGTGDTPLIGLPGRIFPPGRVGDYTVQGSHPGPLSFYLIAPTYRLAGSTPWGLLAGMIVLNLVAVALVLWLAHRRGGAALTVATAGLVVLTVRGYGWEVVTQPWNPYLPLLFWLVVLFAAWGVLAGDHRLLVVVVAVGSLCAQTHMPYLGLALGMGALCVAVLAWRWFRHPLERRDLARTAGAGLGVGVVLWLPPLWDQVTNEPGNFRLIVDYFGTPPDDPVGTAEGVRLMLRHLDVTRLLSGAFGADGYVTRAGFDLRGSIVGGLVVLAAWLAAVVVAVRLRHRDLLALHAVLGWTVLLGVVSMSRIFGKVWYYLTLWAWTTTTLVVASVVWTVVVAVRARGGERAARRSVVAVAGLAAFVSVGSYVALTVEAFGAEAPEQHLSDGLRAVAGPTERALRDGVGAADGPDGTYLVTWSDSRHFGSQGFGLLNDLDRDGFHVGALPVWRVPATPSRTIDPATATAEVRLATGSYVDEVRALPGAVEVVVHDPRDADERAEYERLEREVADALRADGRDDLVALLDTNLFGLQLDPAVAPALQRKVDRMLELGTPIAVFILPPGAGA
jgi:hypothetical protein